MPEETDAKNILTVPLSRTGGDIRMHSYHLDEDYPARPEIQ